MQIPRNVSGPDLLNLINKKFGYTITRQVGSHIRVTTTLNGEHHLTIPNHFPIKIGTLNGIVREIPNISKLIKKK